ncbi:MAG: hypothetical protein QOI55_597, partial [Actinomycetota bacterium]|nr:hypothetical protein [Actinomycetota bacterium]
ALTVAHRSPNPHPLIACFRLWGNLEVLSLRSDYRGALTTTEDEPAHAAQPRLAQGSLAFFQARPTDAISEADAVLLQPGLSDATYAAAENLRLIALMAEGDFSRARAPAEAILGGDTHAASGASLPGGLTALASIAWVEGHIAYAVDMARAAVLRSAREPPGTQSVHPRQTLAVMLAATGELDEAEQLFRDDLDDSNLTEDHAWAALAMIHRSGARQSAGRLAEAVDDATAGLLMAEELGFPLLVAPARSTLAGAYLLGGDHAAALQEVQRCRAEPTASVQSFELMRCDWVEARVTNEVRGPVDAVEVMAAVYADPAANTRLLLEQPSLTAWLVRTALGAGHRRRAEVIADAADGLAAANRGTTSVASAATHAFGLLHRDPEALEEAAAGTAHPLARAAALEDLASLLESSDQRSANDQRAMSLEIYERTGAMHDAERVRADLQNVSSPPHWRPRWRPPGEQPEAWAGLTEVERRVSQLVAQGLTNRQVAARLYISRHTVDFHLRQVFRKLGVRSRVELARIVFERGDQRS